MPEEQVQKQQLSRISPLKKAKRYAAAATVTGIALPFAFGINTFTWVASWLVENWPQLIIIAAFVVWFGKSQIGGSD